jgi:hypothetical protein
VVGDAQDQEVNQKTKTEVRIKNPAAEVWIDWIWTGSVALLTGFAGLYFGSMTLFRWGVPMSPWHGLLFAAPALGVCLESKPGRTGWAIWLGCMLLTLVAAALTVSFHDFSWDGMAARQGMVEAIALGNTPRALPAPHALSAWIACLTGQINSGKAFNLLAGLAAFGAVLRFLRALHLTREWAWVVAATAALNPVFVYQLSSYYIDGFTGSLLCCLVCAYGLVYLAPENVRRWFFLVLVLCLVATSKISGLLYIFIFGLGFLFLLLHKGELQLTRALWISLGAAALFGLATVAHTPERGNIYRLDLLYSLSSLKTPGVGAGGASAAPAEAAQMNKLEVFLRSHMAPTRTMATSWDWKFPFWFNRPELALFEDLEADPRSGGFGPLYGGMLLLAAAAAVAAICQRSGLPWTAWIPALTILASCLLSQAWWARWVPQGWLVPIALAVPVLTLRPAGLAGILARLSVSVGLLNSILILAFYTSGCFQYQGILNGQMRFLRGLPAPIGVHVPTFASNQTWLRDSEIDFTLLSTPPSRPSLILQGTDTRVALPLDWKNHLKDPSVLPEWNKRKLLEDSHP